MTNTNLYTMPYDADPRFASIDEIKQHPVVQALIAQTRRDTITEALGAIAKEMPAHTRNSPAQCGCADGAVRIQNVVLRMVK